MVWPSKVWSGGRWGEGSGSSRSRKAIVVLGQSNTLYGRDFTTSTPITGELDTGISQLGYLAEHDGVRLPAGIGDTHFSNEAEVGHGNGYAYPLAKEVRAALGVDELMIIPVAFGGTSFAAAVPSWNASGVLFRRTVAGIRRAVDMGYEIAGIFWSQGESDVNEHPPVTGENYSSYAYVMDTFFETLRQAAYLAGQSSGLTIPCVTFDMLESWVGADPGRLQVQAALEEVGARLPYSANADFSTLSPPLFSDGIHYDSRQQIEMGQLMYDAWEVARNNSLPISIPAGEYEVFRQNDQAQFARKWDAVHWGTSVSDDIFSRLGQLWRYRNSRNVWRLKLEAFRLGAWSEIVWEQSMPPIFASPLLSSASTISVTPGFVVGGPGELTQGFAGLMFTDAVQTFLTMDTSGNTWWGAVGVSALVFGGKLPVAWDASGTAQLYDDVKLSVIVD